MKRICVLIVTIVICFLLQSTVFQVIALAEVVPNLLLIVTGAFGYMRGRKEGLWIGFFCGLIVDLMYGDIIGICTLIYMVVGYINGIFHMYFYRDVLTIPILLIGISDIFYNILYYTLEFLLRSRLSFLFYLRRIMLPELVYTVLVAVILYSLLHNMNGWLERVESREG